jgi:hypothetical protein
MFTNSKSTLFNYLKLNIMKKQFICSVFNPTTTCTYQVTGDEATVIDAATNHVVEEHGYQDSPGLRQQISDSLITVS